MAKDAPDHHDAELVFRAYELRREPVMRDNRKAIIQDFWPKTYADFQAVLKADHPLNAAYRQVGSYWEMVYGIVKHGIVNADYFLESNGEGFLLFAKAEPFLAEIRRDSSPNSFRNAEWVATQTDMGRRMFAVFSARVKKALESK